MPQLRPGRGRLYPRRVIAIGGDGGRDAWIPDEGTIVEFKSVTTLGGSQKRQIERSLELAARHEDVLRWIVMVPWNATRQRWAGGSGCRHDTRSPWSGWVCTGEIPLGDRCDVKALAAEAGVDRTDFYGNRPYAHLRAEFERHLRVLQQSGDRPDPRDAQIVQLKNDIITAAALLHSSDAAGTLSAWPSFI